MLRRGPDGSKAQAAAKGEMDALVLFKRDLGLHVRVYEFLGQQWLNLAGADAPEGLKPVTDVGSGEPQDRQKQRLAEIIAALDDLFEGDLTDGDRVAFTETIRSRLVESDMLRAQAAANSREQFGNSPALRNELLNAIIAAMEAHGSMSRPALNSESIQAGRLCRTRCADSVPAGPGTRGSHRSSCQRQSPRSTSLATCVTSD